MKEMSSSETKVVGGKQTEDKSNLQFLWRGNYEQWGQCWDRSSKFYK